MIKLYSQPGCPQCRVIHMLLDKNNISYEDCQDINIMKAEGVRQTPALRVEITETDENGELVTRQEIIYGKAIMNYIHEAK